MQRLNQAYAQRFNRRHRPVGYVLQVRYKAIVGGAAYRRFVAQGIGLPSVWEGLRGQMWLGAPEYPPHGYPKFRPRRKAARADAEAVELL
jgi:hypothetical protein